MQVMRIACPWASAPAVITALPAPVDEAAARGDIGAVDARDFIRRNLVFVVVAPGEHHEGREGADRSRAMTIHQMCQISAKPMMVAKNAQTKPVGELRGISIGW